MTDVDKTVLYYESGGAGDASRANLNQPANSDALSWAYLRLTLRGARGRCPWDRRGRTSSGHDAVRRTARKAGAGHRRTARGD